MEPDHAIAGLLPAVARFGIVDLGLLEVDLEPLGLGFDVSLPSLAIRPRDSAETVAIFDRPARAAQSACAPSAS